MTRRSRREIETAIDDLSSDNPEDALVDGWSFIDTDGETPNREPDRVDDGFEIYTEEDTDHD